MVSDRVGDFIVRLQNAGMVGKANVSLPYSAHIEAVAKKLRELGYVATVESSTKAKGGKQLDVTLAFDERGNSKIHGVKRISKPGRRLYTSSKEAHGVKNGIGARILSTPKGILSDKEARKVKAGGEDLFEIW